MKTESSSSSSVLMMYVGWEEVSVSNDKGRREVHYLLKRRDGRGSDLAVVAKERSPRHMSYRYVLRSCAIRSSYSYSSSVSSHLPLHLKFRSRKEVVDWLSSIVSDFPSHVSSQPVGGSLDVDDAFGADIPAYEDTHLRKMVHRSKEFLWLGSPRTCRKRRRHYQSFCRNGITISVHDFVYVLAEENKRLVAYLEDLYEDSRDNKMVVVRWFHKIDEVGIILPPNFNDREIFFSLCLQDLSVECIDGSATILSPQHFEKYLNEATHTLWEPFMCHRQFDDDNITAFDITQVQGYWKQEILRYMYTTSTPRHLNPKLAGDSMEVGDDDIIKTRPKKKHRKSEKKELDMQIYDQKEVREAAHVDNQKFSNGLVSNCGVEIRGLKEGGNSPACLPSKVVTNMSPNLAVGSHIEVLSQDSGIRGCWFRAVVLKRHKDKVKVRYQDIKDVEDEAKGLEEWILEYRVAVPDELGLRLRGRTTVRPDPSSNKCAVLLDLDSVDVGIPVDGWWHDAWWEGIVVRKESEDIIHVYFPGERQLSILGIGDLRCSQDWVSNRWTPIKGRPDLVCSILFGLETRQDGGKSGNASNHSVQVVNCDDKELRNDHLVDSFSPKDEKAACNNTSCMGNEVVKLVPDLAKDDFLTQLKWNSSRKRRHGRERLQRRRSLGSKQQSDGSSSSSRSEDLGLSPDSQRFLLPDSLMVDNENWKYPGDSLLNVSMPRLTSMVMTR